MWWGLIAAVSVQAGDVKRIDPLVPLPGGTFTMGSPEDEEGRYSNEGPQHEVTISALSMCKTEVTQGLWETVMGSNPSDCDYGCGADLPVQNISWRDAILFMNRLSIGAGLEPVYYADAAFESAYETGRSIFWKTSADGYRLPTEAEWEYAARAGTTSAYSFDAADICEHANLADVSGKTARPSQSKAATCDDGYVNLAPVRSFPANDWGLYDMHGNVWEWVWDPFNKYTSSPAKNPQVNGDNRSYRMLRGGSFISKPGDLRAAVRLHYIPVGRGGDSGLRCARGALPEP